MFKKKLEIFFLTVIIIAVAFLSLNYYRTYSFKHNPLPKEYLEKITRATCKFKPIQVTNLPYPNFSEVKKLRQGIFATFYPNFAKFL